MRLPALYPILDTALVARRGLPLVDTAAALLDAGVEIVQLRHKGQFTREVFSQAERIADRCAQSGAIFIVNDRADMAAILGVGVHLGQDDLLPADARKVLPAAVACGFSTHNERQLRDGAVQPVDYLALGPMFPTASKENPDPVVGLKELRRLRPFSPFPLVAIGGITRENAAAVWTAGADSVAVIGDLFPEGGLATVRERAQEWLKLASYI